jgi:bifunctional aspartokinase / homoserine dehydrogenase 1
MRVVKFGGSSVADAARLRHAGALLVELRERGPVTAVVSAMGGVTDGLLGVAASALAGDGGWRVALRELGERHRDTYRALIGVVPAAFDEQWVEVEREAEDLLSFGPPLDAPAHVLAAVRFSGWGERLSVALLAAATTVEGGAPYPVEEPPLQLLGPERAGVVPEPSALATRAWLGPRLALPVTRGEIPILPGYIARDADGRLTTLGRNSSDYSAAMIAAALGATSLTIYGDVAGIYSADPRVVSDARLLPALTYDEAARVASLGAKALHPRAVEPLAPFALPLELRDSSAPHTPGTDIGPPGRRRLAGERQRDAAWVVAARPAATAGEVELSALWLPAWPDDDEDRAAAVSAAPLFARLSGASAPQVIARDELRVSIPAPLASEMARALHAALAALTFPEESERERLEEGA